MAVSARHGVPMGSKAVPLVVLRCWCCSVRVADVDHILMLGLDTIPFFGHDYLNLTI